MSANAQAGQQNFRLKIVTGIDFTQHEPTTTTIQYQYRGISSIGEWMAEITAGQEANGEIYHDFDEAGPVPAAGPYKLRAKMTIDGKLFFTRSADWVVGEF